MNPTDDGDRGGNGVAQRAEPGADPRLARALEEYRGLLEAGAAPERSAFLARHPDLAEALAECLSGLEFVHAVAPAVSGAAAEAAAAADAGAGMGPCAPLGDFRILREVGRGGMGVVYEAEQLSLGRRVALKVLPFASTLDPRQLQRFHNEARAAAGLHHTNIVPVYAVGSERGVHYYAMQFIEGRTLAEVVAQLRGGPPAPGPTVDEAPAPECSRLAPRGDVRSRSERTTIAAAQATSAAPRDAAYYRRVAGWGIQAAEALDCAHALGVVHRDVKPANLLVDAAGRLWVTDFGLAQVQSDARLTMTGDLVGTLRYMSPEQALAKRVVVDHRTDLYSLGATLYELLTLEPAFAGSDRQELLRQIAFEEPKAPRRLNRAIPAELETIVLKALEKNPAERYATAQELADDLRRFQEDRPIRARRASVVQRLRKLARRHRPAVRAAAVCLLVSLVALGGSVGWALNDRVARQREAESKVLEALEAAEPRLRVGNPADLALLSAAERIEAQLGGGAVGPEVRRRAEQFLRDLQMLADLEDIRLRLAETPHTPRTQAGRYENRPWEAQIHALTEAETDAAMNESGRFDQAGTARRYAAAYSQYGIDVLALESADAAARIRASAIHEALLAGLDGWVQARPKQDPDRTRLRQVADAADDNAWRRAFRDAALAEDVEKVKALAGQPEAIKQPPAVLAWIGGVLRWRLPNESAALLRQAQVRHPGDFWINYNLGNALCGCRPPHHEEAIGYFRAALAIRPSSAEAQSYLAQALFDKGDREAALPAWQQALAVDPKFTLARLGLAGALDALGRHEEALVCYQKAAELDPKIVEAHFQLGLVLYNQGRHKEGEAQYREAIRLKPDDPWAHNKFGRILDQTGRYKEAEAEFREAIRLKPDGPVMYYNLGGALFWQRRWKEAEAEYREAISLKPDDDIASHAHNNLGQALEHQERYKEAEAEYREAIRLKPDDAVTHGNLGSLLTMQGRHKEAELEYREAIRLEPHLPGISICHNNLGAALEEQGRHREAEAEYREAIRLKPDDPAVHTNLANNLMNKQGRYKEAEAEYREAIRLNRDSGRLHNDLGVALAYQARLKEAEAEYREAIRLNPDDPAAHFNLGFRLEEWGRSEDAQAAYSKAIKLQPENGRYWARRGSAYADLGQWEKASADFVKAAQCKQPDAAAWYYRAMLCLRDGNLDGYRKICADMLQRFGQADIWTAWTCVLAPNSGADPAELGPAAEKGREKAPNDHLQVTLLGTILYRAGRFDEAAKRLTEATALNADPYRTNMLYTWFFLAMAHHRLGHPDQAHRWLDKAIQATEEALKPAAEAAEKTSTAPGTIPPNWNRKLTLQLLRREAKELIQAPGTKPAK